MAKTKRRSRPTTSPDGAVLIELRGLRKDLVAFAHLLLRQQRLDRLVDRRLLTPTTLTREGKTEVRSQTDPVTWTDLIHDLDEAEAGLPRERPEW